VLCKEVIERVHPHPCGQPNTMDEVEATPVAGWHWGYMEREEFEGASCAACDPLHACILVALYSLSERRIEKRMRATPLCACMRGGKGCWWLVNGSGGELQR
jgi:hypothetical protein